MKYTHYKNDNTNSLVFLIVFRTFGYKSSFFNKSYYFIFFAKTMAKTHGKTSSLGMNYQKYLKIYDQMPAIYS